MPGVPKSRGCKSCLKQKKKCDQAKPACSRCARLGVPCIGSGEQKYVFKSVSFTKPATGGIQKARKQEQSPRISILHKPQSPLSTLEAKLVAALEVTDMRYSLCCYGDFLDHIPRRLGHNEVLDASVDVMISGLPYHYTREHSSEALAKYSRALKSLRGSLNRPGQQVSPETLSAIYIIMICQGWLGRIDEYAQNHGKVLAQLASTAIQQNWGDAFGLQLLEALFVPLTLEAMVNPTITMQSWYPLLDPSFPRNSYDREQHFPTPSLQARRLAQMPNFFHDPVRYIHEIKCAYRDLRDDHPRIQRYLEDLEYQPSPSSESDLNARAKQKLIHKFQVVDAVLLTISIALNGILRRAYPDDSVILLEASTLTNDMIALAQTVAQYRPFGASYIPPCLAAVWATTSALASQQRDIEALIAYYQSDFAHIRWMDQARWFKSSHEILLGQLSGTVDNDVKLDSLGKLDVSMVHCKAAFGSSGSCFFTSR